MTPALPHTLTGEKLILGLLSSTREQGASHLNTHELCPDPRTASPRLSPHLLPSCPQSEQKGDWFGPFCSPRRYGGRKLVFFQEVINKWIFFFLFRCLVANKLLKNPLSPHVRALTL